VQADAPGRVNLIGEHTDYNGGFVMPIAIPQRTQVELSPRLDGLARVFSAELGNGHPIVEYAVGRESRRGAWIDYVQGVTSVLAREGHVVGGFDLRITSEVPVGGGLSSSAALEIALLRGLRELFGLDLDPVRMAQLGQRAENDFVGAPVGIMDQMAAALADEDTALFLDARTLEYEPLGLPPDAALAVVNSGIRHDHAAGEYRVRRAECERACSLLGVAQLRDQPDDPSIAALPPPLDRRVRHVVTENARVREARDAMRRHDSVALGRLFAASHASMRDDYEVSRPEIDRLVASASEQPGVFGARLTGGGFGGCIILLAWKGRAAAAAEAVVRAARERCDGNPSVVVPPRPAPAGAAPQAR
jgi:galactokinase